MFKNTTIWCIILAIVVFMVVHHYLLDKPLLEGNQNALYGKGVYCPGPFIYDETEPNTDGNCKCPPDQQ